MSVRTGKERFAILMRPMRGAEIGVGAARQPFHMEHAPLHGIETIRMTIEPMPQATAARIKGVGDDDEHIRSAGAQGAKFFPRCLAGKIAFLHVEDDEMFAVNFGFHAGNEQKATFAGIGDGLGIGADFLVPRHSDGMEPDLFRLVDVLENRVPDAGVARIPLAMTVELNAIERHGKSMLSFWMAKHKNMNKVSYWQGNSPDTIKEHYLEGATAAICNMWVLFQIFG